jgi:hypothetical protein
MAALIDFAAINQAGLRNSRLLLQDLIPGGKFRSLEYVARNPRRNDQNPGSFSINYKTGVWKDFATQDGGADFISLVAYLRGSGQGEAARELAEKLGVPMPKLNGSPLLKAGPQTLSSDEAKPSAAPKILPWGDDGPPPQNEVRCHVYRNADRLAVRIKIKHGRSNYANWYRIFEDGKPIGWQAKKPDHFQPAPYVTAALDPFDPELKDDQILWPEGERDVDTLSKLNLPAFTFGGVGDGLPSGVDEYLTARHLVILADNDDPGRAHAERKATRAHSAEAASVRIVYFPELPPKGDVSDFIAGGGTAEQLTDRIDGTPVWVPAAQDEPISRAHGSGQDWRARVVMANDLQAMTFPPVRQILPGYISEGATIIAGKPKIGKSWLTLDLCLAATADRFTLGTLKPAQGDVLYLALEDNNRRLKRRMVKLWPSAEARWPGRLALVTDWKRADEGGLDDIEDWCRSVADPVMIVIDTLEKFRPLQKGNSVAYSADYGAVTGLQKIAGRHRIAVVINHHVRKMEADDPFDTVSGTLGLTGAQLRPPSSRSSQRRARRI